MWIDKAEMSHFNPLHARQTSPSLPTTRGGHVQQPSRWRYLEVRCRASKGHHGTLSNPNWIRAEGFAEHLLRTHSAGCTKPKQRRTLYNLPAGFVVKLYRLALWRSSSGGSFGRREVLYLPNKKKYMLQWAFDQSLWEADRVFCGLCRQVIWVCPRIIMVHLRNPWTTHCSVRGIGFCQQDHAEPW